MPLGHPLTFPILLKKIVHHCIKQVTRLREIEIENMEFWKIIIIIMTVGKAYLP